MGKYLAEHVFGPDAPYDAIHRRGGAPKVLGDQLPFHCVRPKGCGQGVPGVLKCASMPFKGDEGGFARRHALFGQISQGVKQPIDASAGFRRNGELGRRYAGRWPSAPLVGEAGRGVA